jgi:asparagine N-glycosylation enzyme membrane subunit Stt3
MSVGGLVLGPFVQKYAFGAFWTGFPWGYDLTDNKTLIMWLVWAAACVVLWRSRRGRAEASADGLEPGPSGSARVSLVLAALVMVGVYLIPHSFKGSQLDYGSLDKGAPASEAIQTGG